MRKFSMGWLAVPCLVIAVQLTFVGPLFSSAGRLALAILQGQPRDAGLLWNGDGGIRPASQTLAFAAATAILQVFGGAWLAIAVRATVKKQHAPWLSLLMLPALIGDPGVAFLFKDLAASFPILHNRPRWATFCAVLAVDVWRMLPLCAYVLWWNLSRIPERINDFASASDMSFVEKIRYILFPAIRNVAFVLALFGFLAGASEFTKTVVIFRSSGATDTEFFSHWIETQHRQFDKTFHEEARNLALGYSGLFAALLLPVSLGSAWLVQRSLSLVARYASVVWHPPLALLGTRRRQIGAGIRALTLGASLVAMLAPFWPFLQDISARSGPELAAGLREGLGSLFDSLPWVIAAAAFATLLGAAFGAVLRLVLPELTEAFDHRSVPIVGAIILLHVVPGLGVAYCVLQWQHILGVSWLVPALWVVAQAFFAFSVLGGFAVFLHFEITTAQIETYRLAGATFLETARRAFLPRLVLSYSLLLVFALATVLGEGTISSSLSSYVTALSVEIVQRSTGRGADFGKASTAVMVCVGASALVIGTWSRLAARWASLSEEAT